MKQRYRFGPFEVRPAERMVARDGQPLVLGARAYDVLLQLLQHRDRVLTKSELLDSVWAGLAVEEANVQVQVSALRKEFGPAVIATVPGRGYRFVGVLLDDEGPLPGPAPLARGGNNLPAERDRLIGREADVAWLVEALSRSRLVTVLGPGGIGKTRVAQQVCRRLPSAFEQGLWWVDLAAASNLRQAVVAIANAAQVQLGADDADGATALQQGLALRKTLLVLDNCEHLARDIGRLITTVQSGAPGVSVLATSQEALKVPGGVDYRLGPLEMARPGASLAQARTCSALQLLAHRARAVDHRFELSDDNVGAAIDLVRHLDGNALAIEMAAVRIPTMGLVRLNQSLDERFRLLRQSAPAAADRQQTLQATLAWSDSLLTELEREQLQQLAVFVGSFRLDVAQAALATPAHDEWAALDSLSALVDKSLVQLESPEPPRYRLLETVRLYMLAQLTRRGGVEAAHRQHGQALATLAREIEARFWHTGDAQWLTSYAPDYDDLQAAFDRACQRQDADAAAGTGAALMRLDHLRNVNTPRRQRAEALHALLPQASDWARATIWSCIASHGLIAVEAVQLVDAATHAVNAWRALGDPQRLHFALGFLAAEQARAQDFSQADRLLAECRALERPDWPPRRLMFGASASAAVCIHRGDGVGYRAESTRELALAVSAGADRAAAWARLKLADAALMAGEVAEALALGDAAVRSLRLLDQPSNLGLALTNLCAAQLQAGDDDAARASAREALPLMARSGWDYLLIDAVALLAARQGDLDTAAQLLGHTQAWYASHGETRQPNEAALAAQARAVLQGALGPVRLDERLAQGPPLDGASARWLAQSHLSLPR